MKKKLKFPNLGEIQVLGVQEYEKGGINFDASMQGILILDDDDKFKLVLFRPKTLRDFIRWLQNLRDGEK